MTCRDLAPAIVQCLGTGSPALHQLIAAHLSRRDPAPAIAQAILERCLLEDFGQAEVYRWIRAMWPTSTCEEMTRAYRIASELFAVDFLAREA
ncbi:hypothetical protein GOFOIKOB_1870 [Methylobacterium tardum]|uniref:Uncharacterized protein n=1 Tax=Methylobacterium tardum TaxID=374432 RepID=A0AA37WWZ7_9HYPH|nr:hypothetical protein [Methylobacterium tardum]URD39289.1 hypothetical protein M6G65_13290 [Methylobacterium tardum]GJE48836.1 hypothetical protein GOFOIKOB_1870 [Methylobacterium tardum]GLS73978.1 hypothetical protein GCM10007890_59930 [Methylobacterium tardum]